MILTIIDRYIAKNIIVSTLLVFFVVLALSFIIGLLGELRDIGTGDYGIGQAILHVLLLLPHTLYQFFPMLVLVGGVLGLSVLASSQELIVMRTTGVSVLQLSGAVIVAAGILIFAATVLGEWVAPQADYLADKRKSNAQAGGQAVATSSGVWIHEGNNFLHIDRVVGRYHLEGVTRYEFDASHRLLAAYYAKVLDYEKGQWLLRDVVKTTLTKDSTFSERFLLTTWDLPLNPTVLNIGLMEPEEMSLNKLYAYGSYLEKNGLQAGRFQFEFWKRIFQPLITLLMMLLAIPFVLTAPRSVTMGKRILFAILVGFGFYILNAFIGQFCIVFQLPPFFAALFPALIFASLGGMFFTHKKF